MTPAELKSARKATRLPVTWLSAHVGLVSVRSWTYWESGQRSVPDDIGPAMRKLARALRPWLRPDTPCSVATPVANQSDWSEMPAGDDWQNLDFSARVGPVDAVVDVPLADLPVVSVDAGLNESSNPVDAGVPILQDVEDQGFVHVRPFAGVVNPHSDR